MLQRLLKALNDKKRHDWVEYGILVGGTTLVCLAATGTLGHRMSKQFAAATAVPGARSGEKDAQQSGKLDTGTIEDLSRPAASDGIKTGDEEATEESD